MELNICMKAFIDLSDLVIYLTCFLMSIEFNNIIIYAFFRQVLFYSSGLLWTSWREVYRDL